MIPRATTPASLNSFETAWRAYIQQEQIGRKNNKSALETQSFVLNACKALKLRHVATISYRQIDTLLASIRDGDPEAGIKGRPGTAARVHSHLRDFYNWCARSRIVKDNPMTNMPAPFKGVPRDRYYTDAEIRAIWTAADQLDRIDGCYLKLIMLTALRRDELAEAKWSEFDSADAPTVFTVPTERVKLRAEAKRRKKPVYIVPLAPLAQRILKGLTRDGERVFPGLDAEGLKAKLLALDAGVPKDFKLHIARHTVATYFQNEGRSEWERGLILNHSASGSVTGGYSHGYPVELKRAAVGGMGRHIERVTTPERVTRLR